MANSIFIWPGPITFSGTITFSGQILSSDGTAAAPSYSFASEPGLGLFRAGSGEMRLVVTSGNVAAAFISNQLVAGIGGLIFDNSNRDTTLARGGAAGKVVLTGTTPMFQLGGTTSSFPALKRNAAVLQARLADDSADANVSANAFQTTTATIATGGGSGTPAFVASSTGGTNQPTTANQNGWIRMQDSAGATIWVPIWK